MGDNQNQESNKYENNDDTFDGYVPQSCDPGKWLLIGTSAVVFVLLYLVAPIMIYATRRRLKKKEAEAAQVSVLDDGMPTMAQPNFTPPGRSGYFEINSDVGKTLPSEKYRSGCCHVVHIDHESWQLISYAIPFTFFSVADSAMENVCLALVGIYVGTKELAAYVVVILLTEVTDQFLKGCIRANTTLCAHAVGASNNALAGRYVQLSITIYMVTGIPVSMFWMWCTESVVLWLDWGDDMVAGYSAEFARVYIWSQVAKALQLCFQQILVIVNQEMLSAFITFMGEAFNTAGLIIAIKCGWVVTLPIVAWIYLINSIFFALLTILIATTSGWLKPFMSGLFDCCAVCNDSAVRNMIRTCIPLSFGSLLRNSRWISLAVFAAHLGEAEIAAWAVMGRLWKLSDSLAHGIGEAAATRIAYHLGNNIPSLAKLVAYKAMALVLIGGLVVSFSFFLYIEKIPKLFTSDETLQFMMAEALPYVGIGLTAPAFGYLSWYILGAQGKYKVGLWIKFVASWGVTIPLAFLLTWVLNWDIQGLSAALVVGYVMMSALMTYIALTSDWRSRAKKIYVRNRGDTAWEGGDDASVALGVSGIGFASNMKVKVLTAPSGSLLVRFGKVDHVPGCVVLYVHEDSPLNGKLFPGDTVIGLNGYVTVNEPASCMIDLVGRCKSDTHVLTVLSPTCRDSEAEMDIEDAVHRWIFC